MKTIATRLLQSVKRLAADGSTAVWDRPMSVLVVDHEQGIRRYEEAFLEKPCTAAGLLEAVALAVTGKVK